MLGSLVTTSQLLYVRVPALKALFPDYRGSMLDAMAVRRLDQVSLECANSHVPLELIGLLKGNGLINNLLLWLGIIHEPLTMMNTSFAVYVGIVYSYLPFMILPLYTNLEKHDRTLLEAAADLGARPLQAFLRVTLPMPNLLLTGITAITKSPQQTLTR